MLPGGHVKIISTSNIVFGFGCDISALILVKLAILIVPPCAICPVEIPQFAIEPSEESISVSISLLFFQTLESHGQNTSLPMLSLLLNVLAMFRSQV